VLAGIAWTTPAIVFAVGVPQAAASGPVTPPVLPAGTGLIFNGFDAYSQDFFWDATSNSHRTVVVAAANVQNVPDTVPDVTTFRLTFTVPVGNIVGPKWGLGSNKQQVYDPAVWTAVGGGPTVSGGVAECVFEYHGDPLGPYANKQPTLWIETLPRQDGVLTRAETLADHGGTAVSVASRTDNTTQLADYEPIVVPDDQTLDTYQDWIWFTGPPPPL